jgi:hypothetical protein
MSSNHLRFLAACAALSLACGSSSGGSGTSTSCTPGASVACVGAGGCQGGQACNADGTGYGDCVCGSGDDGGATDAASGDSSTTDSSLADSATETGSTDSGIPGETGVDGGGGCSTFTSSSIAAMRQGQSGCYSLATVVSLGATPSAGTTSLHIQDAAGGSYSAMRATCSSTSSTYPCTHGAAVAAIPAGHSVTVTGTYVKDAATHAEAFYIASIVDDGAAATVPLAAAVSNATIERSSMSYDLAFQRVTLSASGASALVMADWTPAVFSVGGNTCPYQVGFAMAPVGVLLEGSACSSGTSQPAGVAANAAEVLIGTDFYQGFTVTSDCRCALSEGATEPSATSTMNGTVAGLLVWTVPSGASSGFMYLAPQSNADLPITATVAGM